MEKSVNQVVLSGFTKDKAIMRETTKGTKVANMTLVIVEGKDSQRKTYVNVTAWKGLALRAAEFPPESRVRVTGRLEVSSWKDKNTGEQKRQLRVTADDIEPISNLQLPPSQDWKTRQPITDSDIPF